MIIRAQQFAEFRKAREKLFVSQLAKALGARYPHVLPRFPLECQERIVRNMLARASAWGVYWQSSLVRFAELMLAAAPNFDQQPWIRAVLQAAGADIDRVVLSLEKRVAPDAWSLAEAASEDLPLFTAPETDTAPLAQRTEAALEIAAWDVKDRTARRAVTESGIRAARDLELAGSADAPLALAVGENLFGRGFWASSGHLWTREVFAPGNPPRQKIAMLKFRIALDHGRFV